MATSKLAASARFLRAVAPPVLLAALAYIVLREPLNWWLHGEEIYDQEAMREWVREARVQGASNLPELVKGYVELAAQERRLARQLQKPKDDRHFNPELQDLRRRLATKREEIFEHLKSMGNPPTKIYAGQLPLFPIVYRLTVSFTESVDLPAIVWDSQLPRQANQYKDLPPEPIHPQAAVSVQYHLHAYMQRQFRERQDATRRLWLSGLAIVFTLLVLTWFLVGQRRERLRQEQRLRAQQQVEEADRRRLEEELRRREAERKQDEAERQTLEYRSQLFANIGIMAGSYAHNIKNLLVRPNDLLRRCLEDGPPNTDREQMLREVKHTLGTVTQRLQQILQTVNRDPSQSESVPIDLNALVQELEATWTELAREKWKLVLELDLAQDPATGKTARLWIEGDPSHLQQALENLLFNARDATFEMRNHLREQVRRAGSDNGPLDSERRQALIDAAAWKGVVTIRTRRQGDDAILEIGDNGIGMSEDVRRRCTDTHFSTKRNNALFAGQAAGMGLGLSFVKEILNHHHAELEVESAPQQGALFRIRFAAGAPNRG
jgi:signal transduction histidine kinase